MSKCFCHLNGYEVKDAFSRRTIEGILKNIEGVTESIEGVTESVENIVNNITNIDERLTLLKNYVTPQMFGAKADGTTDDTEAIQTAIDFASANNLSLYVPKGTYLIENKLVIDNSIGKAVDFVGAGVWCTTFLVGGEIGVEIKGNYTANSESTYVVKQLVKGFLMKKKDGNANTTVKGINIDNLSSIKIENVYVAGFTYGIYCNGIDHSSFENVSFQWNDTGLYMGSTNLAEKTAPNNIDLYHCRFASNKVIGAFINFATTFNMVGGSVEHCGTNAGVSYSEANCGIALVNGGYQGGVACNINNVYFESNAGIGDVYLINISDSTVDTSDVYNITGCSFNKAVATHYTLGNITCKFNKATAEKQFLNISGCSFKAFNTYIPNSERKSVYFTLDALTPSNCSMLANNFMIIEEKPIFYVNSTRFIKALSSTASLGEATATIASFVNNVDNGLSMDGSTGTYTITETGLYDVSCMLYTTTTQEVQIRYKLNGEYIALNNGMGVVSLSQLLYLEEGDTLQIELWSSLICDITKCELVIKHDISLV